MSADVFLGLNAPSDMVVGPAIWMDGAGYFFGRDTGASTDALWKTDGTLAGTVAVGVTFPRNADLNSYSLKVLGDKLLFAATTPQFGREMWVSDGTSAGTGPLTQFVKATVTPQDLTIVGTQAFFSADDTSTGRELWVTDGTSPGTHLVKDIRAGANAGLFTPQITPLGPKVIFVANDGVKGTEFWSSDGTSDGTQMMLDLSPNAGSLSLFSIHSFGDHALFAAFGNSIGSAWYATDGTAAGTHAIRSVGLGVASSWPKNYTSIGSSMFFSYGATVWETDGSAAGTKQVIDLGAENEIEEMVAAGGRLFFTTFRQLLASDGTQAGTVEVRAQSGTSVKDLHEFKGRCAFVGYSPQTGVELWQSDGTPAGTQLLDDIAPSAQSSSPSRLSVIDNRLFFQALNPLQGAAPYITDGTKEGTTRLRTVAARQPVTVKKLSPAEGFMYVFGSYPSEVTATQNGIWVTDGTVGGTHMLAQAAPNIVRTVGSRAFFSGPAGIWTSDGTPAGTLLLKDGTVADHYTTGGIWHTAIVGSDFYFVLSTFGPDQLWKTDGTPEGTTMVYETKPLKNGPQHISYLNPVGEKVFFWSRDDLHESEPWVTDGTAAGTQILKDLNPQGSSGLINSTSFQPEAAVGSQLYFTADDGVNHAGLWVTDGTGAGTRFVKILQAPGADNDPNLGNATLLDGVLYFGSRDITGAPVNALWRTDGTEAGTYEVKRGLGSGIAARDNILFTISASTNDGVVPHTLYAGDGTTAGMNALKTFGPADKSPSMMVNGPDGLYFGAALASSSLDLWKTNGTLSGTQLVTTGPVDSIVSFDGRIWFTSAGQLRMTPPIGRVLSLSISGGTAVDEGADLPLSAAVKVGNGSITGFEWDLNYDGATFNSDATGISAVFSAANLDGPLTRTVALRVTDDLGAQTVTTMAIDVLNVAPTASLSNSGPILEGWSVTISFSGQSDPVLPDRTAGFRYSYDLNGDGDFDDPDDILNSADAAVSVSFDDSGSRSIRGRIMDKDGGFTDYQTIVQVANVAPTIRVSSPEKKISHRHMPLAFTLSASDPSAADLAAPLRWHIDWNGDGIVDEVLTAYSGSTLQHFFTQKGDFAVTFWGEDKDGGLSDPVRVEVQVRG